MVPRRLISEQRPKHDMTLMAFLRSAQEDAGYSEDGFCSLLGGSPVTDSRRAERREFDWWTLARFFNATPDELHAMSERSLFYEMGDASNRGHFRQRAPWVQEAGYGAHSPSALRTSEHWRKSWLGPAALVCRESKTVLVRHCHGCGGELSAMVWRRPSPICPVCCAHLALGPVIPADGNLIYHANRLSRRYDALMAKKPVDRHDYELAYFACVWRAAHLLDEKWRFVFFRQRFSERLGLGSYATGREVSQKAIRHAQRIAIAGAICDLEPTLLEHYWLMAGSQKDLKRADEAVLLKLTSIVEEYTGEKPLGVSPCGQTTISLASWSGWNSTPKAA